MQGEEMARVAVATIDRTTTTVKAGKSVGVPISVLKTAYSSWLTLLV